LHTDECYVCIISFIRSVLALTWALALMSWPWPWSWGYGLEALALTSVYIGWQPLEVVRSPALRHLYGTLYRTTSKTLPFRCLILRSRLRLFCFPDTN